MSAEPEVAGYGPSSEAWLVNREIVGLMAAGPRALLLQIAHPLIAEGVKQHSHFQDEPRARAERTTRSYLRIVFGGEQAAHAEIRRLNRMHAHIQGPVLDATARVHGFDQYRARDPELSLWVHSTLIDSTLLGYTSWVGPLSEDRQARFYQESRSIGLAFGIPDATLPRDLDAFRSYMAEMVSPSGPVSVTPTALELAGTILHPPLGPLLVATSDAGAPAVVKLVARAASHVPTAIYDWTLWPALQLLPPRIRDQYGIPHGPVQRAITAWLVSGYRSWRLVLPDRIRWVPQATAAYRRTRSR